MTGMEMKMELIKICDVCSVYYDKLDNYRKACVMSKSTMPELYESLRGTVDCSLNILKQIACEVSKSNDIEFDTNGNSREDVLRNVKDTCDLMEVQLRGLDQIHEIMKKIYGDCRNREDADRVIRKRISAHRREIQDTISEFHNLIDAFEDADDSGDRDKASGIIPSITEQYQKVTALLEKYSYVEHGRSNNESVSTLYNALGTYWDAAGYVY